MSDKKIVVFEGDGIGPEIARATVKILKQMPLNLEFEVVELRDPGNPSAISDAAWSSIRESSAILKAPTATPQGGGHKSLNVTLRNEMSLYANVRPVRSYHPFVPTMCPGMDLVIVRENSEDLYIGREYLRTPTSAVAIKSASVQASARIAAYGFEYARTSDRKKVTCMTKDNILKITDGIFHRAFREVAAQYPSIGSDHKIIDIGAALLASNPKPFEVIVTTNLYGDIISDIAAQVAGSVGLAGSANLGDEFAMFEAIHGTAPDIAGRDMANPSGMMNAAVMMLCHLGLQSPAESLERAWLKTLEDGLLTADMNRALKGSVPGSSSASTLGTMAFADAVINNLGKNPSTLLPSKMPGKITVPMPKMVPQTKGRLRGVDVSLEFASRDYSSMLDSIRRCAPPGVVLSKAWNGSRQVYPLPRYEAQMGDDWTLRLEAEGSAQLSPWSVWEMIGKINSLGTEISSVESLYEGESSQVCSE